jgi:CubicO group peptidase (beta-lactamase class C family)
MQNTSEPFAETAMREWKVPGAAVAVVGGQDILSLNCYGVCKAGSDAPVEADTVFPLGSLTKAFTAALIAMEVDRGTLAWNTRVGDILPDFSLPDPWITEEFRVHDLLTMRTGLPSLAGTAPLYFGANGDAVIESLQHIAPTGSFRLDYAYQNVPYMIAGKVLKQVTGKSWEQKLAEHIVKPLGMRRTGCT